MDKNFKPPKPREMFAREPLSVRLRNWRPTVMQIAFGISLALHGALLGVRFIDPEDFNRAFQDTPLEIVLVNARTREAPAKAQAIAQANMAGGGELDQGMATSPLVASPTRQEGTDEDDLSKAIDRQMQEQAQMLQQIKEKLAEMAPADPNQAAQTPQQAAQMEQRKQMLKNLAAIEKTIQEQNSRPRRTYVSPDTREELFAAFGDNVRQIIEVKGTRAFPRVNGKPLSGTLFVNVIINARGEVVDVNVKVSSGKPVLDQRAVAIARSAGPFKPFSPELRKKTDELVFTWRFNFESGSLSATTFAGKPT